MSNYSGYIGLFKQPQIDPLNILSNVYTLTDSTKSTIVFIILTPSAFHTIFEIARRVTYVNIYLVVPSMDIIFASDIFNIFQYFDLLSYHTTIHWVFPIETTWTTTSVDFENNQIITSSFALDDYVHGEFDNSPVIQFELSTYPSDDRKVYNIKLFDGEYNRYFSIYNTASEIAALTTNTNVDYIHLNYNTSIYSGVSYKEIENDTTISSKDKIITDSFVSTEEFYYCRDNNIPYGMVIYNDLI